MAADRGEEYGMKMLDIYVDAGQVAEVAARLGNLRNKTNLVLSRAANEAMVKAATEIKREVTDRNALRYRDVESILKKYRATQRNSVARLTYTDGFINLAGWSGGHGRSVVRPWKTHDGDGPPDSYSAYVKKANAGGRTLYGDDPNPFLQISKKTGDVRLFRRTGRSRFPIKGVAAPAVPQVVHEKPVMDAIQNKVYTKMVQRIDHQIVHLLNSV